MIKHKVEKLNHVADALSRCHSFLSTMQTTVFEFDHIKELYAVDADFGKMWKRCLEGPQQMFVIKDGFLYYGKQLCIPQSLLRESIVRVAHEGGLAGHFGHSKTLKLIRDNFYWPKLNRDVVRLVERCKTCRRSKMYVSNQGLYEPLPIPTAP